MIDQIDWSDLEQRSVATLARKGGGQEARSNEHAWKMCIRKPSIDDNILADAILGRLMHNACRL